MLSEKVHVLLNFDGEEFKNQSSRSMYTFLLDDNLKCVESNDPIC